MSGSVISLSQTADKKQFIKDFIDYPKKLYKGDLYWLPWSDIGMKKILHKRHPFFSHSDGEFFLLKKGDDCAGRICVIENTRYAKHHGKSVAHFFFLDFPNSMEHCTLLLEAAIGWAADHGLKCMEGPMLFGGTYGSGILVDGFNSPPPMTMMPYNYPYYGQTLERLGFRKWVDLYSASIDPGTFRLPGRIARVAGLVEKRSELNVLRFTGKGALKKLARKLGEMYNCTAGDHPEAYPLTDAEINALKKDLLNLARPELIRMLADEQTPIGYLMAFPDLGPALRRNGGKAGPLEIIRLLKAMKGNDRLLVKGMGIIDEYQGRGGNALLYNELVKTVSDSGSAAAELVRIAETADLMLKDLQNLGAEITKTYRMYTVDV